MMTSHKSRLQSAGRSGTKGFVDPNKVFIGNLNFTATEDQVRDLVLPLVPSRTDVRNVEVVREWKTKESKGYAFVTFLEPVHATVCLSNLDGKRFLGRPLKVTPVHSKLDSPLRQKQLGEEKRLKELRKLRKLQEEGPPPAPEPKFENPAFLGTLDPDLIVRDETAPASSAESLDVEDKDQFVYFDEDDFDPDDYDGVEVPGAPAPKGFR